MKLHVVHLTDSHGLEHAWWWLYADSEEDALDLPPGVTIEVRDHAEHEEQRPA